MIQRVLWGTLYGVAFMFISGTMLFSVLATWPDPLLWLKLGAGLAAQFGLGVFAYMQDPEGAWKTPPTFPRPGGALLLVIALAALAGCATIGDQAKADDDPDIKDALQQFVATDAATACRIATRRGDPEGTQCFCGIEQLITQKEQGPPIIEKPVGAMSALADARAIRLGATGSRAILKRINLVCAALVGDELVTFTRVAAKVGIKP